MLILGIETSCDETAAAIVENGTRILSNVKATTLNANRKYGGVVPDKTAREQLKLILPIIAAATKDIPVSQIDAIAVTYGPGLIGSLLIGVETAKTLALTWNKPLIPVNHLVGHIYASWMTSSSYDLGFTLPAIHPHLPALALIASGAHCDLVLVKNHNDLELLGSTLDDAAGECFDKCGRLLELPYPYGPFIENIASEAKGRIKITLPRPLLRQDNLDFSFSGLKTAFLHEFKRAQQSGNLTQEFKATLAFELQESVSDVLSEKFIKAAKKYKARSLILTGGVAANKRLREKLQSTVNRETGPFMNLFIPPIQLCTDNAAYIASAAFFNQTILPLSEVAANPSLTVSDSITNLKQL
jgi:N6-L-threonylcarbamoyladenine synthase